MHIFFFMKIFIFLLGTMNVRVQYPHELMRYCSPIYVLCVSSHFWPFTKANFVLENFDKKLEIGSDPPAPGWDKIPSFAEIKKGKAPLMIMDMTVNKKEVIMRYIPQLLWSGLTKLG